MNLTVAARIGCTGLLRCRRLSLRRPASPLIVSIKYLTLISFSARDVINVRQAAINYAWVGALKAVAVLNPVRTETERLYMVAEICRLS